MKTAEFNYCNRFILHFVWFGLTLGGFIYFIFLFRKWLDTVGINPDGYYISDWWFEHKPVFFFVIFGIPCLAYCMIFLISMLIAVKLQDKKGKCVFYENFFVITFSRKIQVNYNDIRSIKYVPIYTSLAYLGRTPHKLIIKAGKKKIKINMSLKESWFNRKKEVSLEVFYKQLKQEYKNFKKGKNEI